MKSLIASALLLGSAALGAQTVQHAKSVVHTEQVDLAYETYGASPRPSQSTAPSSAGDTAIPVIAVNGGPGLSHAYMVQNDLWERLAGKRMVVFYDQRGTGASKRVQAG